MEQIEIKSDALGIVKRNKAINNKYQIFYNLKNKKYVLYLTENNLKPKTYCLTFPYDCLDERAITHTLKSEIQNRKAYLEEIENENALLLKQEQKRQINEMEKNLESKRNY